MPLEPGWLDTMNSSALMAAIGIDGDVFTEYLGAIAVVAFALTVTWVAVTLLKEGARKQVTPFALAGEERGGLGNSVENRQGQVEEEVREMEQHFREYYEELMAKSKTKLNELVVNARSSLASIARSYARVCSNPDKLARDALEGHFLRVCESQWNFFRAELGYVGMKDIEPHLRMALATQFGMERRGMSEEMEGEIVSPTVMRRKELTALQKSIPAERLGLFQMEALEAAEPFKFYYSQVVREWINDVSVRIVRTIRKKAPHGTTIRDTSCKEKFVRLKNTLDTIAKLSERLESNMQNVGEEEAAFFQILFGSVILSILSQAPQWFPELGDCQSEEIDQGAAANGSR